MTALAAALTTTSSRVQTARRWWLDSFAGAAAATGVPELLGRPPAADSGSGRLVVPVPLAPVLARHLAGWAGRSPARLLAVLAVAAGVVTARYGDRQDLLVGTPMTGTGRLLPLRLIERRPESVADLLTQATRMVVAAAEAADGLPAAVVRLLGPDESWAPCVCVEPAQTRPGHVDVVCAGRIRHDVVEVELDVALDRLGAPTARRMAGHLGHAVARMAEQPEQPIHALDILAPAERQTIVRYGDGGALPAAPEALHCRVAAGAAAHPDRTATVYRDRRLSYGELDRAARAVAEMLAGHGVTAGTRVALLLDRGDLPVVAALGAFTLGVAYVPIDTGQPGDRLRFMLSDSAVAAVITEPSLRHRVPDGFPGAVLVLDDPRSLADRGGRRRPGAGLHDVAYAIYTSGTTGVPKAVLVDHGAFAATCQAYRVPYDLAGEPPVALQLGSIAFDVFNGDLGRSLYAGGTLVICPDDLRTDVGAVARLIAAEHVTILESTPVLVNPLAEALAGEPAALASLRVLISSADAWRAPDYLRVRQLLGGGVRVFNTYGVTEAAIDSTCHPPDATEAATEVLAPYVPIGVPLAGVRTYVLDRESRLMPLGAVGELCLAGAGLARGYLNRPALTAERFVPNPSGERPGERLYRTGDLVRYRDDGHLEFLGRADHQVKIRGFRVELGEVETVLRQQASVTDAVVVARTDDDGNVRLVAYVVTAAAQPAELRRHCADWLPDFMVPASFVTLTALPVNANGKVDRRALPEPEYGRAAVSAAFVAPRDQTEEVLASAWAGLLGLGEVGVDDDFFELGGHSLLAMRVVARVSDLLGASVTIRDLFEARTVAGLAGRVRDTQGQGRTGQGLRPIDRAAGELVDVADAQRRLWFLHQWQPDMPTYHIPLVLRLRGRLHEAALARALDQLVSRHEALRTVFAEVDGVPMQRVIPHTAAALRVLDLRGAVDAAVAVHDLPPLQHAITAPFDLNAGPPLRAVLIRVADDEHLLGLVVHHIVADGWSMAVIVDELAALYNANRLGRPAELPAPAVQFADVAVWQRETADATTHERELRFWRGYLDGIEPLSLPLDRPRPSTPSNRGDAVTCALPRDLVEGARGLARQSGASLYMVLLAAFEVVLGRYSGQEQFAVGTVSAGRPHPVLERVVGFFVNTLPIRVDLGGAPTFVDLITRVREHTLDALAHEDTPFDRLTADLVGGRDTRMHPVFQVAFVLQNTPQPTAGFADLDVREEPVVVQASRFDMSFALVEEDGGLVGAVEYATDLFDRGTIELMLDCYRTLLTAAVAEPETPVDDLPLLGAQAERRVVAMGAGPGSDYPRDAMVHELFAARAAATPDAPALVQGARSVSYHDLDMMSDRLAARLAMAGVGMEHRVAVAVPRGPDAVVAMLAVLKAAAAYVPVDPREPVNRIRAILRDAGARLAIADGAEAARLEEAGAQVIRSADPGHGTPWRSRGGHPRMAAYVMHTSGSTGEPKGVLIEHRSIVELVWRPAYLALAGCRFLQLSALAFDAATLEIWGPLLHGGTVVLLPPGEPPDANAIAAAVRAHGATAAFLTAGLFHQIVDDSPEALAGLRHVITGGDVVSAPHAHRFRTTCPQAQLVNGYGPTEFTTFACCHVIGDQDTSQPVPLGRPIDTTQAYVLDDRLRPVPPGVIGELCLAGVGLARGYPSRPGLTALRFVPDPFVTGRRIYRTGDLARLRADGRLEFVGRRDGQVKLRGFRVELGEVEAALRRVPGVHDAVAIARNSSSGPGQDLIAYLVGNVPQGPILRAECRRHLPDYMVPGTFVTLPAFPLTPNGKVDRRALPEPEPDRPVLGSPFVAPRSAPEARLAEQYADLLGLARVGVLDDFFELGGHSLLVLRLLARVRRAFGVELPVRAVFEDPTVAGLAARVVEHEALAAPAPRRYDRGRYEIG